MDSEKPAGVVVLSSEKKDEQLMLELLRDAGFDASARQYQDLQVNAASESPEKFPDAVVVCHRHSEQLPEPLIPVVGAATRLLVVSNSSDEKTIVDTLEKGAHHFFAIGESRQVLQARLHAALRRHSTRIKRFLDVAPFRFNLERRTVHLDGELVKLSPKEYEFAHYLFSNRDRVVINSELMTSVWSLPSSMDARRIDTAACRVRKKMQLNDSATGWNLKRLRRIGYQLEYTKPQGIRLADEAKKVAGTPDSSALAMAEAAESGANYYQANREIA